MRPPPRRICGQKAHNVIDAGTFVHADGALAQVEGSVLWGLSMELHERTEFVKGQVKDANFDSYTPLRSAMCRSSTSSSLTASRLQSASPSLAQRSSRPPSAMPFS